MITTYIENTTGTETVGNIKYWLKAIFFVSVTELATSSIQIKYKI